MKKYMLQIILGALILGVAVGYVIFNSFEAAQAKEIASYFELISALFLRLIKMIIAPLVFSTLVVGIAHMGDTSSVGRIFVKTMMWFIPHRSSRCLSASSWFTFFSRARI